MALCHAGRLFKNKVTCSKLVTISNCMQYTHRGYKKKVGTFW